MVSDYCSLYCASDCMVIRMTETEINEAVARKLGWKECECASEFRDEHRRYMPSKHIMPNYCGDIAAAWEIVEYIKSMQKGSMRFDVEIKMSQLCYLVDICGEEAEANTAPMAICQAFLKLTEE